MGRVSIIVNEWAHHRTPKSCRETALVIPGCARPTFKEARK